MAEYVTVEVADAIATVRIGRPPVNALTMQVLRELAAAAEVVGRDSAVDAVVLYGGEKVFAAGDDLAEIAEIGPEQAAAWVADRQAALDAVAAIARPTVAAISGYALDGGLELALCADRRIIGDNVKLGLPQTAAGLIPGGLARLAGLVGPSNAKDLVFTGRFVEHEEAARLGLVDEVVAPDDVYSEALRWAQRFVGGPRAALAAAKASVDGADPALESRLRTDLFATADAAAGVRSFLDNGPGWAVFTGQ